jgi:hypothetical protein
MKKKLSIAGWVVINLVLLVVDLFVVPWWSNDHHGFMRLVGMVGLPVLTVGTGTMLVYRIVDRIKTFLMIWYLNGRP